MENSSGAVRGNSQNNATTYTPRTESKFNLMYHFFNTHRFAEYVPHYAEDSVKKDRLPIRSSHSVNSYTLKSPLIQTISMSKDYFSVPYEAILPLNWEKFYDHPVRGDDVLDDVGCGVEDFWSKVGTLVSTLQGSLYTILTTSSTTQLVALRSVLRFCIIGEMFYSNGSLMSSLGCHGAPYFSAIDPQDGRQVSWDTFFDQICSTIEGVLGNDYFTATLDGVQYRVGVSYLKHGSVSQITLRHFLSIIRDNPVFTIDSITPSTMDFKSNLLATFVAYFYNGSTSKAVYRLSTIPNNLSFLWAYQLCCAHYFSNDHVDFVYSAELFRQLIGHYLKSLFSSNLNSFYFTRNGISYQYDYLSAHFFSSVISFANSNPNSVLTGTSGNGAYLLGYFSALFSYRRSLRYLDYFSGSRVSPLAVSGTGYFANTNVPVVGNQVSVIDITKSIQSQRFLNAVNRVRHSFEGYLKGIFGGDVPAPDYHNPFFLAHTDDVIYGDQTDNTGAAQMSQKIAITSNLHSNGSRYMFEIRSDRPCVVIGITHYDIPRVYSKTIERHFFDMNRYDMFNPFMQYIGDQPIYQQELGIIPSSNSLANFSYTLRHMQYKQRYFQCAGGFVENLPGWIFVASDQRGGQTNLNPDWIRSVSSEFDDFYVSLTGFSLGSYFHFIVDNTNDCTGSRPMAYAPTIL